MADQAVLKYLSIDTTFDPCYFSWDSPFKAFIQKCQNPCTLRYTEYLEFCRSVLVYFYLISNASVSVKLR